MLKSVLALLTLCFMVQASFGGPNLQALPNVTLPWGTWQADSYDPVTKLLVFRNIRFAKSPTGKLRFQKPQYPDKITSPEVALMNNTYGPMCHQVATHPPKCKVPLPSTEENEDCLFLDVYVPESTWMNGQNGIKDTSVIVWIYGGAYEYGAKSAYGEKIPLYSGDGIIAAAQKASRDVIFVAGNYRLGAFGWLAGETMEDRATANAGLYDQRLVFQWVQDFIGLFGGDKGQVSAWGESAGAGSIMHHLTAFKGQQDPLFQHVFVQSPAFSWKWNRTASEEISTRFAQLSGCKAGDFDCLTVAAPGVLQDANQKLFEEVWALGQYAVGPSTDNGMISELPAVAFQEGHYWKGLKSLAASHVHREGYNFIPNWVTNETEFNIFLSNLFPGKSLQSVRDQITAQYPSSKFNGDQQERLGSLVSDTAFLCNTRQLYDAYSPQFGVYMMHYYFGGPGATHASDLLPTFSNLEFTRKDMRNFLEKYMCMSEIKAIAAAEVLPLLAPDYQSYLADFGVFGNPNQKPKKHQWIPATSNANGTLQNVMLVAEAPFFDPTSTDYLNTREVCSFWNKIATEVSSVTDNDDLRKFQQEL